MCYTPLFQFSLTIFLEKNKMMFFNFYIKMLMLFDVFDHLYYIILYDFLLVELALVNTKK